MATSKKDAPFYATAFVPNRPIVTQAVVGHPDSVEDGLAKITDHVGREGSREGRYEFVHDGVFVRVVLVDKSKPKHFSGGDEY